MRFAPANRTCIAISLLAVLVAASSSHAQFVRPRKADKAVRPREAAEKPRPKAKAAPSTDAGTDLLAGLSLQLALERNHFSPGIIDSLVGPKTRRALAAFQTLQGLNATGELDDETRNRLQLDAVPPTKAYKLTKADASRVGPCPTDWLERAKAERLPFRSLIEVVAFEGHCTHALIRKLNPSIDIDKLAVGQTIKIPNVIEPKRLPDIRAIAVDFGNKQLLCTDDQDRVVAIFYCSIARQRTDRPEGECKVRAIAEHPVYTFRPESWPEVKNVDRVLQIPPGPRNPVGLCWIDLTIDGYGIHGTPEPELIGKTGSHGCIRLTNWDVLRLARMVRPGMKVALLQNDQQVAAAPAKD